MLHSREILTTDQPTRAAASAFSTESYMEQKYRRRVVNQCRFESLKLILQNLTGKKSHILNDFVHAGIFHRTTLITLCDVLICSHENMRQPAGYCIHRILFLEYYQIFTL